MMMERRAFENALVEGLVGKHLKHHRYCLEDVNTACDKDYDRLVDKKRRADYRAAKEERACVSHEHLCRMVIVDKKSEHRADNNGGYQGE